jgi:ribosomal protein S18 acetylase RimI-like enzyme
MTYRVAAARDRDAVIETIALAFSSDPVWGAVLAQPDGQIDLATGFWQFYVDGAMRYSTVLVTDDLSAVAAWIPPGGIEMSEEHELALAAFITERFSPSEAVQLDELFRRFDANHVHEPSHAYLNLLATHPEHRGQGIGQILLAENLRHWDEQSVPAYLESTNPANLHRYRRAGFEATGEFRSPINDAVITMMWRPVGG